MKQPYNRKSTEWAPRQLLLTHYHPHTVPTTTHLGDKVVHECMIFHGLNYTVYPFGRQKYDKKTVKTMETDVTRDRILL